MGFWHYFNDESVSRRKVGSRGMNCDARLTTNEEQIEYARHSKVWPYLSAPVTTPHNPGGRSTQMKKSDTHLNLNNTQTITTKILSNL